MIYIFDEDPMFLEVLNEAAMKPKPRKPNRAERRAQTKRVGKKRQQIGRALGQHESKLDSLNALAVRHPMDCGKTCFMCHGDKLLDSNARRQQGRREAEREAQEGLNEWLSAIMDPSVPVKLR